MQAELPILAGTAATIGFIHTVLGPDHYLPFIALSKARQWNTTKTCLITLLCGAGHVLSSIVLGFIGIALGIAVFKLEKVESLRGEIGAWLLIIFGFTYLIWGLHKALQNKSHRHLFLHKHKIPHGHDVDSDDPLDTETGENATLWVLFIIFVLGPCEPLIPLIMYPAAKGNIGNVAIVALIFGLITIATMLGIVLASSYGLSKLPLKNLEKYSHALAGLTILLCGGAIKFLGL